ncbi:MAG: L-serine ammonia-lyase, iron-sulfur-dependent, subunit alpha [Planctomycetota bacterium]|jgi:L-serine dehydratase
MAFVSMLNDVMGPVMRGPSSSHTAGAYRIASIVKMLADDPPSRVRVTFDPEGSNAPTYRPLGMDLAFAAALLGWDMTDERYDDAMGEAERAGLDLSFAVEPLAMPQGETPHPNDTLVGYETAAGDAMTARARSVGGGVVEIYEVDGLPCMIDGKSWAVLVSVEDSCAEGAAREVGSILSGAEAGGPRARDGLTLLQWDLGEAPAADARERIGAVEGVRRVRVAEPVMYVRKGDELFASGAEMVALAAERGWGLGRAALEYESQLLGTPKDELVAEMLDRYDVMRASVERGLDDSRVSLAFLGPSAGALMRAESEGRLPVGGMPARAVARGLATVHVSNSRGVVCAAPTGGAAGVMPGILVTLERERGLEGDRLAAALFAASAVGLVMARRATFAAEEAGCQVEIGVAGAMAAAAVVESAGGTAAQAADAASISLQNTIGLVCDPVGGGCEIPCHTRTAVAISGAFTCADLAMGGYANPITLDDAVDASYAAGKELPAELRCTALGGVAVTPSALDLVRKRSEK